MPQFIEPHRTPDADPDGPPNSWARLASVRPLLTDQQEAFAQVYAKSNNATKAYHAVYATAESDYKTWATAGAKYARNPKIKARVEEIREEARKLLADKVGLTVDKVAQMFFQMATADPNELIGLRVGCCRRCYGEGHQYQWKEHEYLEALEKWEALDIAVRRFSPMPDVAGGLDYDQTADPNPECPACMGEGTERVVPRDTSQLSEGARLLYQGVKVTKNGLEIQMADRSKALEAVGRILGAFKDGPNAPIRLAVATAAADASDPKAVQAAYEAMLAVGGG